jgi:hypothetical protein
MSAAVESAPVANPPAESTDATQSDAVLASAAEGEFDIDRSPLTSC